ncbi:hypothetical protein BGZ54_010445 [Gamsiella multidivaricata]|nr:hypothetical protein BGZ54_010445 [Gamsiella multidivaricata]
MPSTDIDVATKVRHGDCAHSGPRTSETASTKFYLRRMPTHGGTYIDKWCKGRRATLDNESDGAVDGAEENYLCPVEGETEDEEAMIADEEAALAPQVKSGEDDERVPNEQIAPPPSIIRDVERERWEVEFERAEKQKDKEWLETSSDPSKTDSPAAKNSRAHGSSRGGSAGTQRDAETTSAGRGKALEEEGSSETEASREAKESESKGEIDIRMRIEARKEMDKRQTPRRTPLPRQRNPVIDTNGLNLSQETLQYIYDQRGQYFGQATVTLYSYGSLMEAGTGTKPAGSYRSVIKGKVSGYASPTKAELAGLLTSILVSPRDKPMTIKIDNSAVVTQFNALVKRRSDCTETQGLRSPYVVWWAAVHNAYVQQEKRIETYMISRFVKAIEETGRTEIWNRRRKVTVDWEREHGITAVSERARGRNCVGEHRRSSNDFMGSTLRQRQVPDVKEINDAADERVQGHYLGQLRLDVMERLGGCQSLKMSEDRG